MSTPIVQVLRPRFRYRLRTLLVIPIVVALGLFLWGALAPPVLFSGETDVALQFVVTDAEDGTPVPGAVLRVADPFRDDRVTAVQADQNGHAKMTHSFATQGEQRRYWRSGSIGFEDRWLEVSAPGYGTSITLLADSTGVQRDINDSSPPPIKVTLRKGKDPDSVLGGLAGSYSLGDRLGFNKTLKILADGRFSSRASGCLGDYGRSLGHAKQADGLLVLSFSKGPEGEPSGRSTEFLPILWGGRAYLISKGEILDFCNAVNQGSEPRDDAYGLIYLRADDWKKKVAGLPELPSEWQSYLLKAPVSGKVVEVLPDGGARISLGSKDGIRQGMELTTRGKRLSCQVKVVSVESDSCVVALRFPGRDSDSLKKGQTVTTGPLGE
jgi:hypothetical protein